MLKLATIPVLLLPSSLWACPNCVGSMEDSNGGNIVYILSGFILLTYIPFYLIYRTIIKNRDVNNQVEDAQTK